MDAPAPVKVKAVGFGPKWKKSKETFFKATGTKKPKSKTFFGLINKPTEGLDKALLKVDEALKTYKATILAEQAAGKGYSKSAASLKALKATVLNYQQSRTSYLRVLTAAGAKAPPEDAKNPTMYKNALVMLDKQLKYIDSALKTEVASAESILNQLLAGKSRADGFVEMSETIVVRIRNAVDKAQAFIAKSRVKPTTRDKFVVALSTAARDISVNLNSLDLIAKKNPSFQLAAGKPPERERQALNGWHTGAEIRALPKTASHEDMMRELDDFEALVTVIDRWAG